MNKDFSTFTPARLYAFQLKLRPVQHGTLMPFNGELVQGAWLKWLGAAAPEVASWLHEGQKARHFTCSSLQFPIDAVKMREAERHNVHLPVDPEKIYTIRITLLLGELFTLFYHALMDSNLENTLSQGRRPFMQIGKQSFRLEDVVLEPDGATGWTGSTSFQDLVERARTQPAGKKVSFALEFASLTTSNRGYFERKEEGNYYARLPLPAYIFPNLAKRWRELAPPHLATLVQKEQIEQYVLNDGIVITDYDLRAHHVRFTTHLQKGFIGTATYEVRGNYAIEPGDDCLPVQQQILLLAELLFYCGAGYKTAMGMGQTRLIKR